MDLQHVYLVCWVIACELVQVSQLTSLLCLLLLMASVAAVLCELFPVPQPPAGFSEPYLPHVSDRNDEEPRFSLMWRVPCFTASIFYSPFFADYRPCLRFHTCILFWNPRPGVRQTSDPHSVCQICALVPICSCCIFWLLVFKTCDFISALDWCFMYPKSQITTVSNMSSVSGKNYELNNYKWSCKRFPGYRGYLALGNIFLSCVYPKDLYSRSHKVMSNSVCVLNLETFLQAVMEERQMDDKSTSGKGCSWSGKAI